MRTVQLAIHDSGYARCLRDLLSRDETCNALVVDTPNPELDGVILLEGDAFDALPKPLAAPDRFVVIAHRDGSGLGKIWNAGVHHVVFEGDSPNTVQLAIIAAQLRAGAANGSGALRGLSKPLYPKDILGQRSEPPRVRAC